VQLYYRNELAELRRRIIEPDWFSPGCKLDRLPRRGAPPVLGSI
jgi:hypothetical protein